VFGEAGSGICLCPVHGPLPAKTFANQPQTMFPPNLSLAPKLIPTWYRT
jgi:hypothetical protein